jgi:hypothetical protein
MPQDDPVKAKIIATAKHSRWNFKFWLRMVVFLLSIFFIGASFFRVFTLNQAMVKALSGFSQQIVRDQQQIAALQAAVAQLQLQGQRQAAALQEVRGPLQNSFAGVNSTELYHSLLTIQKQLEKLPPVVVPAQGHEVLEAVPTTAASGWEKSLQNLQQGLRRLVVVYRLPATQTLPFVTPDQQPFIYQNIYAVLNQAIWAVFNHNNTVYQTSLQQAIQWIQRYFLLSSPLTTTVLAELFALQTVSIEPTKVAHDMP